GRRQVSRLLDTLLRKRLIANHPSTPQRPEDLLYMVIDRAAYFLVLRANSRVHVVDRRKYRLPNLFQCQHCEVKTDVIHSIAEFAFCDRQEGLRTREAYLADYLELLVVFG